EAHDSSWRGIDSWPRWLVRPHAALLLPRGAPSLCLIARESARRSFPRAPPVASAPPLPAASAPPAAAPPPLPAPRAQLRAPELSPRARAPIAAVVLIRRCPAQLSLRQ